MNSDTIVLEVIDALEAAGVPYMLVGSFSSNLYGVPRSTKDADFVVQLGETPITAITGRLSPGFSLEPQMSFETITGTYRYVVRHAASAFSIEFFQLSNDPHDIERFARRRKTCGPSAPR